MYYLLCQDWNNTSNNHAGIKHLCRELTRKYKNEYRMDCIPDYYLKTSNSLLNKYVNGFIRRLLIPYIILRGLLILTRMKKGDVLFMMEYLEKSSPQYALVPIIRLFRKDVSIYGMVHLVPSKLQASFSLTDMYKKLNSLDYIITLGSSLSSYLNYEINIPSKKLKTLFHYVDLDYYLKKSEISVNSSKLTVIAMGNQMRNLGILKEIVQELPETNFIICQGNNNLSDTFSNNDNVKLIPFVPEDTLKSLMDKSDISLNCMLDTIGSNVIVTSMAMGLAMVCSDVGSIHDYCSEQNCIFCKENEDYISAIRELTLDKKRLLSMKQNSIKLSKRLTIENFHQEICNINN